MSMEHKKVTCDGCGSDLTTTGNSVDWRLDLKVTRIPCWGGAVTDMGVYKPLKQDANFCGLSCLQSWLTNGAKQ